MTDGFLLVDKPEGISSFGVLQQLNRHFQFRKNGKKFGHGGTLDPGASGLLVVAIGKATRLLRFFLGSDKRYTALVRFGERTSTDDSGGDVVVRAPYGHIQIEDILHALDSFKGTLMQVPPAFSALHIDGKRAYELARQGRAVEMSPREIRIYQTDVLHWAPPDLELDISCSGGTYIRSIARDLGQKLGSEAHLAALRRTGSCHFNLGQARPLDFFTRQESVEPYMIPIGDGLGHFKSVNAPGREIFRLLNGQPTRLDVHDDGVYVVRSRGVPVAVLERKHGHNDFLRLMSAQDFALLPEGDP